MLGRVLQRIESRLRPSAAEDDDAPDEPSEYGASYDSTSSS